MPNIKKKLSIFLLAVFLVTATGSYIAEASFLDIIRAFVTINPLALEVSAPSEVEINRVFKVEAKAINKGGVKIENAEGEIFLPVGLSLLGKSTVKKAGIIPGRKEKKISWSVKGENIGSHIVSVSISGELNGSAVSAQGNTLVVVQAKFSPLGRPINFFQRFFNIFQIWFNI